MKIKSLTLYKTQLDSQYKNVIDSGRDGVMTKEKFKTQVLDAYYSPLAIYNSNNIKSVKETDGDMVVCISREYTDIMNDGYNYVVIDNGSQFYFYFITNMESLNDGDNPSMLIGLERDAWSNNIEYFTSDNHDDKNQVIRSHFNRWYGSRNSLYPYYIPSNDISNFATKTNESYYYIGGGGNVVWCGVRFSKDTIVDGSFLGSLAHSLDSLLSPFDLTEEVANVIKYISEGYSIADAIKMVVKDETSLEGILNGGGWKNIRDLGWVGSSMYESSAPIIYFPTAIISGVNDGIPDISLNFTATLGNNSYSYSLGDNLTINKLFNFEAEEILESFLTTTPPFKYTVSNNNISVSGVYSSSTPLRNSSGSKYIFPYSNDGTSTLGYIYLSTILNSHTDFSYTYQSPLDNINPSSTIGEKLFDKYASYRDVLELEPRIYCSPYVRLYSTFGQAEVEIPVISDKVHVVNKLLQGQKTEPMLSVFLNNDLISGYNNIGTPGGLPTSYDKWKDYVLGSVINMGSSILGHSPSTSISETTQHYTKNADPEIVKKRNKATNYRLATTYKKEGRSITEDITQSTMSTSGRGIGYGVASGVMDTVRSGFAITGQATRPTIPSVKANNNIEKFFPKIVTDSFSDIKELHDVLGEMYLYGYRYPDVKSVRDNCRVWFDYCETAGCILSGLTNYHDRQIIESAFDRGITKWHAELDGAGFNSDFNRNLNNVEREWISTIELPYFYKFQSSTPTDNYGTAGDDYDLITDNGQYNDYGLTTTSFSGYGAHSKNKMYVTWNNMLYQFKISELSSSSGNILAFDNYSVSYDNTTDKILLDGADTGLLGSDVVGKTVTIYYRGGGSYYNTVFRVWLDGELITNGLKNAKSNIGNYNLYICGVPGLRLASVSYSDTDLSGDIEQATEWVASHQLPGVAKPVVPPVQQFVLPTPVLTDLEYAEGCSIGYKTTGTLHSSTTLYKFLELYDGIIYTGAYQPDFNGILVSSGETELYFRCGADGRVNSATVTYFGTGTSGVSPTGDCVLVYSDDGLTWTDSSDVISPSKSNPRITVYNNTNDNHKFWGVKIYNTSVQWTGISEVSWN
jgi:hypothetical protein